MTTLVFRAVIALMVAVLAPLSAAAQSAPAVPDRTVVLRGVDKLVGRTETIEVSTAEPASFGQLSIAVYTCEKAPPTERPEVTAFLQIREMRGEEESEMIFSGWMFASSPSLNALEHPVYDLWVTDCKMASGGTSTGSR